MRVARFQTLFAVVGLYALGFVVYLAASISSRSLENSNALQMFPIGVGADVQRGKHVREFGGRHAIGNDSEDSGVIGPSLRCLGWKQTENCDPDAPVVSNRNRTCDQYVRGAVPGYCLMVDEDTGEELRIMRTTCDSIRPDVVFTCRHAGEFADFQFAVNSLAKKLRVVGSNSTKQLNSTNFGGSNASTIVKNTSTLPVANQVNATDGVVMVIYPKLLVSALASIRVLRSSLNSSLPIEMWYSPAEMHDENVTVEQLEWLMRNGSTEETHLYLRQLPTEDPRYHNRITGFNTKVFAITHSQFDNVLFLDADNVPVRDPRYLFATREFREFGAIFWPDFWHPDHTIFNVNSASLLWELLDMPYVDMFEQESGQLLIDRRRARSALRMLNLLAFHEPNIFSRLKLAHGDKDLFRLAWLKTQTPFYMVPHPPGSAGTLRDDKFCGMSMVQADPNGDVLFLHRNAKKLTGGRGSNHKPDELVWTHLQRFHYLGRDVDARRISPASTVVIEPTTPPPTRAPGTRFRSGKLDMLYEFMKRSYQVEIYNGAPQFPATQWCYGQMSVMAPRYKTVAWKTTAFPDIERQLLQFASDAVAELPPEKKVSIMTAPIKLNIRLGGK